MNYIGSKHTLSNFIKNSIVATVENPLNSLVFCDLFAGTGSIGKLFKPLVYQVIANDIEYYSYVLNRNYIGNSRLFEAQDRIDFLNNLKGEEGFIFTNYSENGNANRLYFSAENGKKIDAIRKQIEQWKKTSEISKDTYYFLIASLLESADKVANTASVYCAFLKKIKKSAQKKLVLVPAKFHETNTNHLVFNENGDQLIQQIKGDILYLDPPYNSRQYGANYHILNTIAKYDEFQPKGITGLRDYFKSDYCKKNDVKKALNELLKNANFKHIFLSYNNEGLLSENEIQELMKQYGNYNLKTVNYQRFKADKTQNRNHKATATVEYLHILEKQL